MKLIDARRARALRLGAMKIALLMFSLLFALILGELLVRVVAPQQLYRFPQGLFVNHPDLQFRLAGDFDGEMNTTEYRATIRTNAAGLREGRDYGPRDAETIRILALGDSFTMGVGVEAEQSFLSLLEQKLDEALPARVEVLNAGVPGYNTTQEGAILDLEHRRLHPDLALLHFYVGNDVHDNLRQPTFAVIDGYLTSGTAGPTVLPRDLRQALQRRSHLYAFLWPLQRGIRDRSFREARRAAWIEHWSMYASGGGDLTDALWNANASELRTIAELQQRLGIDIVVVVIPEPIQISASAWQAAVPETGTIDPMYRREFPNVKIAELCRELGLPVLDLLPTFKEIGSSESTYFRLDGHWTPLGNELAAEALARFLLDRPALLDPVRRGREVLGAARR